MKKLFLILLTSCFVLMLCSSCEEEPPVVLKKYCRLKGVSPYGGLVYPKDTLVIEGNSATFRIEPFFGWNYDSAVLDSQNVNCKNLKYTIEKVTKNHVFEASFKETLKSKILGRWRMDSLNLYNWGTRSWEYHKIYNVPGETQTIVCLLPYGTAFIGPPENLWVWKWDINSSGKLVLSEDKYNIEKFTGDTLIIGQEKTCREVYFREYTSIF
jgi:hypothetical protein